MEHDERIPDTYAYLTQSGGAHLLFKHADGTRNSTGHVAPGIDVRGDGGFRVDWSLSGYSLLNGRDLCEWPDWSLPLVRKPAAPRGNGAHASNGQSPLCAAAIANIHTPPPLSKDGLRRVWTALSYIGSENRDDWLRVGGALHDITSWPEKIRRAFFDLWSVLLDGSEPKKFDPATQQTTWESYGRSYDGPPTTLGTIIHWAKENGWNGRTLKRLPDELLRFFAAIDDAPAQDKPGDASLSDAEVDAEIARLADLPVAQYERERKPAAERLSLRVSVLDKLVDQLRPDDTDHADGQGRTLKLVEPEPWPTAVDGAQLVCELAKVFGCCMLTCMNSSPSHRDCALPPPKNAAARQHCSMLSSG